MPRSWPMKLYRRALHLEPDNAALLEAFGEACLQMGQRDEACEAFGRSVELQPDGGAHRYMYLGQLRSGAEAVESFARGVAILRSERAAVEQRSGSREELQQAWVEATHALVSGLCSTAEIYLTDACDEPNAEESCEALAMEALSLVESLEVQTLAEPFVTAANLRLSQQRNDEATELLVKACSVVSSCDEANLPPFDLRLSMCRMLMEVDLSAEAVEHLQNLRLEDDDSLELRYLLCYAAFQTNNTELGADELEKAIAFAQTPACDPDEKEWLPQLLELQSEQAGMEG